MLKIFIPDNYIPERTYILDVIFREFLGQDYIIYTENSINNTSIELKNNAKLVFQDHFFSNFKEYPDYLNVNNIPFSISFASNQFIIEPDIPVIYGNDFIQTEENCITCGIDIFAGCFFMLARWEEYCAIERDEHNRFPAFASVAYKNNFLHRPVVNEYVEMLWNMLKYLGISQKRKTREAGLVLTHDIDSIRRWDSWKGKILSLLADIVKRKNFTLAIKTFQAFFYNSFDTFDYLMDLSEKAGIKSRFYFMSGGITAYDNKYNINDPFIYNLQKKINNRSHITGFHPSYASYNNGEQWKKEKTHLENTLNCEVKEGRQHYLRFEVPTTWQIWEDNNMETDSTCGYADCEGFRCGTGDEFSVFNVLTRKKLKLKEKPLIIMDGTLFGYRKYSYEEALNTVLNLKKLSEKYKMTLTNLAHNSYFYGNAYKNLYEKLLGYYETFLATIIE